MWRFEIPFLSGKTWLEIPWHWRIPGIHWWYKTASHAAELTAGFYNPCNRDGYAAVMSMLKKHGVALDFTTSDVGMLGEVGDYSEAIADPAGVAWQVLSAARDVSLPFAGGNSLPCHNREGYNKIVENAKPDNDPDRRRLLSFGYQGVSPQLLERHNLAEFERFVKKMHDKISMIQCTDVLT